MLEYITFTNVFLVLVTPVYISFILYLISYSISYGFNKGLYVWRRDHEMFLEMMEDAQYDKEIQRTMSAVQTENPTIQ